MTRARARGRRRPARPRRRPRRDSRSRACARHPCRSRCRRERFLDRVLLFVRQLIAGPSALYGLGEDAGVGAAVQARENDTVAERVQERDRERLVASGVGERVISDHADLLDRPLAEALELVMQLVERIHSPGKAVDAGELTIEDLVDAAAFAFREHATQPAADTE